MVSILHQPLLDFQSFITWL